MRHWFARRAEEWRRFAPLAGAIIQSLTLALVLYGIVGWTGGGFLIVPLLGITVLAGVLSLAWFYYEVLGMRAIEQGAIFAHTQQNVSMLSLKEARLCAKLSEYLKQVHGETDFSRWLEEVSCERRF